MMSVLSVAGELEVNCGSSLPGYGGGAAVPVVLSVPRIEAVLPTHITHPAMTGTMTNDRNPTRIFPRYTRLSCSNFLHTKREPFPDKQD